MQYKLFYSLCIIFWAATAIAHQSAFSYLELRERHDGTIHTTFKKPLQDRDVNDLKLAFSRHCYTLSAKEITESEGYIITRQHLECQEHTLVGSSLWVYNLLENDMGVIVKYINTKGEVSSRLITADEPYMLIRFQTPFIEVALRYVILGVEHILGGFDHLMFVLMLLFLVQSLPRLIQTITAFTVAHSITLGLATLGFVDISIAYIEAMIALSILFLARELLLPLHVKTWTRRYPWIVAFLFGLLHGFGFASALSSIGLDQEHLISTLLFFNLGVELGQLLFIGVVLILFKVLQQRLAYAVPYIKKIAIYGVGITSAYWFIERLFQG